VKRSEVLDGLKECLASLGHQARAIPKEKSWSPAEKLAIQLAVKFEYNAVREAIRIIGEDSEDKPVQDV
jgi:hypothetical protein